MLITLSATLVLVIFCVILHYEAMGVMRRAGDWLHRNDVWHHSCICRCSVSGDADRRVVRKRLDLCAGYRL